MFLIELVSAMFFWLYFQVFILLLYILSFPANLLFKYKPLFMYAYVKYALKVVYRLCGVKVEISWDNDIQPGKKTIFLLANQPGVISALCLIAFLPKRVRIVAEEKIFAIPVLGKIMKEIGCLSAPVGKRDQLGLINIIMAALKNNENVLIYAENIPESIRKMAKIYQTEITRVYLEGKKVNDPIIGPGKIVVKCMQEKSE